MHILHLIWDLILFLNTLSSNCLCPELAPSLSHSVHPPTLQPLPSPLLCTTNLVKNCSMKEGKVALKMTCRQSAGNKHTSKIIVCNGDTCVYRLLPWTDSKSVTSGSVDSSRVKMYTLQINLLLSPKLQLACITIPPVASAQPITPAHNNYPVDAREELQAY